MLFILTISFKPGLTEPAIQLKTSTWLAVEFTKKKHTCMTLMIFKLEPALWSCDIGQQIPCFDRCQKTITSMAAILKILFSCQKRGLHHRVSHWHTWSPGWTYSRMVIKTKFSCTDGCHNFLTMVHCMELLIPVPVPVHCGHFS